ncbi:MAG: hypothetical protein ABIO55_06820, partial [Ginsengibacter sp.]
MTIAVFLCTLSFNAISQADLFGFDLRNADAKIDSLKKNLPEQRNFKRIDYLNGLSEAFLNLSRDTARLHAEQALEEAIKINYIQGQAKAYQNLGRIECAVITDLPSAEKYFSKSLSLFITTGNYQQIGYTWGALGYSKWVLGKFSEAMEALKTAEKIFLTIADTSDLIGTYDFMNRTEREWGHYAKSLEYTLRHKDLTGEEDSSALSGLYYAVGDYETAEKYSSKIPIPTNNDARSF